MKKFFHLHQKFLNNEKGCSTINEYSFEKKIGEGGFGKVKLAIKKNSGEKFAIKIFRKSLLKRQRQFFKIGDGMYYNLIN